MVDSAGVATLKNVGLEEYSFPQRFLYQHIHLFDIKTIILEKVEYTKVAVA
jgi:hypothetical protein